MGTATNPECFVLSWQDFSSNIVSTLQDIREQEDFYDVTLACDEEHVIQSHKVILSASSPYFRGILKRSPAQNPVLLMPPGVRFRELSSLIDFIYNGKVQIASEDLNSFLALAKQFKIKGLTEETPVGKVLPTPKPAQQAKSLPKFPPGIQMVKRGPQPTQQQQQQQTPPQPIPKGVKRGNTADHENASPFKTFHAGDGARVVEENVEDDETEDDAAMADEDIPDDAENYFDDYDETDYGDYDYDETGTPIPHTPGPVPQGGAPAGGGLQLTGLLCPQCRTLCHGVDALKDHMSKAHGMQQHSQPQKAPTQQQQQQQPAKVGGSSKEASEALIICHICDKTFKNHRYMVAHQKRLHQIEPERKIGKGSKLIGRPKKKKDEDGDEEGQYDTPGTVAKPILLGPSIARSNLAPQGGPKKEAKNPESVGPGGSTPVQRQPNLGARPLPQGEQFLMSDGIAMPGPSRRLPQPGGRLPPGAGTIMSRAGPSAVATVHPIDIKSLNHKLGGQISISSSDPSGSKSRRPLPSSTAQSPYSVANDGVPMMKGDSVRSGPSNRPQQIQGSHLKEAASIEELDVVDDDEDFEGEEDYDETQYGEDCDDGADYDDDGVGHPGMDMSDSVDGMYGEEHYEDEEELEEEENH